MWFFPLLFFLMSPCLSFLALSTLIPVCAKLLQSCPTLCHPKDCSPPGSSVHGILQQEYWSGLPCPLQTFLPLSTLKTEIEEKKCYSGNLKGTRGRSFSFFWGTKKKRIPVFKRYLWTSTNFGRHSCSPKV